MIHPSYPELDDLLAMIGAVGKRMAEIGAGEGAAGNISICLRRPVEARTAFPVQEQIELPLPVPGLAGATLIVSGSGRRLREIQDDPPAHLACVRVDETGRSGALLTSPRRRFERLTSELNSHLAVHQDQILTTGGNFHALIHAQPVHLTYLSHIPRYQDETYLNTHLLRWQPETIINLPEGIGLVPFHVPGSPELMAASVEALRRRRLVLWARHGVMARADLSIRRAADCIEYAETAARYEYLNLSTGEMAEGLSPEEIRAICRTFNVDQRIYNQS